MGAISPTISLLVADDPGNTPDTIGWFEEAASGIQTGAITGYAKLQLTIDQEGESYLRFEQYLDDGATPYDTYDEFFAGGTVENLQVWWAANP